LPHLKTRIPTGSDVIQHADMKPAFNQNLFEQILQRDNLQAAWKRVRANKGAAGVDSMTIRLFQVDNGLALF
jgi:RNA-directed DNA polymerase